MTGLTLRHWCLEHDTDELAWLTLDRAQSAVNALSSEVMTELASIPDMLDVNAPKGLIIRSEKSTGFIVGADVNEFATLNTPEQSQALVRRGWNLFNRLADVPYPTLALIQGNCLGGGLELALACRYRLVVDQPGTSLALPGVMLGIFPGWGGMLRLPALIGLTAALDMMLTGRNMDARRAAGSGLADARVAPRLIEAAAKGLILSGKPRRRARGIAAWLNRSPFKSLLAKQIRKRIAAKDPHGHYPTASAIVELLEKHNGNALQAPALIERVISSDTARNLLRVFHLQERLKAYAKALGIEKTKHVYVVGAGVMGSDIAAWCAIKGMRVTLQDQDASRMAPAFNRVGELFRRRLKNARTARAAFDRLIPDPAGNSVVTADLIIEAISENSEAKRALYHDLESRMKPQALLATNTSSLSLETLRTGLKYPERLIGIHFFNPVAKMPLVEVVQAAGDDGKAKARVCAFVGQIDKLPLPNLSAPGFLVNAVLAPYMLETMHCIDEGISAETLDAAMEAFGMPMGPTELIDTVGLDIALAAGAQLTDAVQTPRCLAERVERNNLGKKNRYRFLQMA